MPEIWRTNAGGGGTRMSPKARARAIRVVTAPPGSSSPMPGPKERDRITRQIMGRVFSVYRRVQSLDEVDSD
jgi:hypothetical protein